MGIVKTRCLVPVVEIAGQEDVTLNPALYGVYLVIESHWNFDGRVNLTLADNNYTFVASELIDAIRRCSR